ncbi:MAG: chromate transporter [Spirochaetaceae bacterium]|nr:chromate transporter [Spirochaetaceae bacterium]
MEILNLVITFFKIGIISFGGGWSIVGLMKHELVPRWYDEASFRALIAIAQSTPGPIALNAATLLGWQKAGLIGAVLSTLSVVAFPVLSLTLAMTLARRLPIRRAIADESLKTGSLAMMLMTLWALRPQTADLRVWIFALAAFGLTAFTTVNPIWVILGAGAANIILGLLGAAAS